MNFDSITFELYHYHIKFMLKFKLYSHIKDNMLRKNNNYYIDLKFDDTKCDIM